jgi:hypothetical protein
MILFTSKEYSQLQDNVLQKYRQSLGKRPTYRSVAPLVDGGVDWNVLKIIAFTLLILIMLFTGAKAALSAVPVAVTMYDDLLHGIMGDYLLVVPKSLFVALMQMVFVLLSEAGLVYFVLLSKQIRYTVPKVHDNPLINIVVNLVLFRGVYTYLPLLMVWGTIVFVFQISSHGEGTIIDKYLPLVMGIALAYVVEETISERNAHRALVFKRLKVEQEAYDQRYNNYDKDPLYLRLLANAIADKLPTLTREVVRNGKKETISNRHLLDLPYQEYRKVVLDVYKANQAMTLLDEQEVAVQTAKIPRKRLGSVQAIVDDIRVNGLTKTILEAPSPKRMLTRYYEGLKKDDKEKILDMLKG